ncbi:hypothetical protein [Hymenobacter sp.]|jgi:hypothetical protein|uniref:hypothetical protein n=1 Tax=Hymenobacter sp. TaxID=1898978 RepID=UPI002ED8EEFB
MKLKNTLGIAVLCFLIGVAFLLFTDGVMPWNRQPAIETVLEWGGLAALPVSSSDVVIRTKGSMFSRQVILRFECDSIGIEHWIRSSKGLKDKQYEKEGSKKTYRLYPGQAGAMGGTVIIQERQVVINMSWS